MNDFGDFLKDLRLKRNLSIRKASEGIGISHTYLDSLEKGYDPRTKKERKPTFDVLTKISKFYQIDYIEILIKAGYLEEAEKERLAKSADAYRKYREKNDLMDIADLNDSKFIFDDIISAAYLNTEFLYEGEKLNREEKIFIADTLRTILRNGVPISSKERIKIINILDELLKERM